MTPSRDLTDKILIRGNGIEVSPALQTAALAKGAKLLRHHARILRVRIDFERDHGNLGSNPAIATGRIEISGPDLVARVSSAHLATSLDLLIDKLDRMIRERTKHRVNRRNDRPAGVEFRDRIARPQFVGFSLST